MYQATIKSRVSACDTILLGLLAFPASVARAPAMQTHLHRAAGAAGAQSMKRGGNPTAMYNKGLTDGGPPRLPPPPLPLPPPVPPQAILRLSIETAGSTTRANHKGCTAVGEREINGRRATRRSFD